MRHAAGLGTASMVPGKFALGNDRIEKCITYYTNLKITGEKNNVVSYHTRCDQVVLYNSVDWSLIDRRASSPLIARSVREQLSRLPVNETIEFSKIQRLEASRFSYFEAIRLVEKRERLYGTNFLARDLFSVDGPTLTARFLKNQPCCYIKRNQIISYEKTCCAANVNDHLLSTEYSWEVKYAINQALSIETTWPDEGPGSLCEAVQDSIPVPCSSLASLGCFTPSDACILSLSSRNPKEDVFWVYMILGGTLS
ncbi:hypothetical protein QE152_g1379 [Popillia japonica]|uniref:Uncharacterized protein n=1 Tax=Popillia japonica TaxID=7064 RepID=A0AAW1N6M7_POPJA